MPRAARIAPGGLPFHVLNRANGRATIFYDRSDYRAFERVIVRTLEHVAMRILSYCIMPNHWHLVLWPEKDRHLGAFLHRLTVTHVRRFHLYHRSVGTGHIYQGPFKSFPIQTDDHLLTVCRYVERNALRAGLVDRAEDWEWGSLWTRQHGPRATKPALAKWPIQVPANWNELVNQPLTDDELKAVRLSVQRGRPFGTRAWQRITASRLGLECTLRPRGRPRRAT